MKIATFNANSIRSRLAPVLEWARQHRPDVLCIQETKVRDADFPADAFHEAGLHVVYRGEKSYNGVAVVTRREPDDVSFGFDDEGPADPTRLAAIRLGPLHIVSTYIPQGRAIDHPMYAYKIEWLGRLRNYFESRFSPSDSVIWTGDMNVAPEPIDVARPETKKNHVCFHSEVRAAFKNVCDWGFLDIFRKFHPETVTYSFFDYRHKDALAKNRGWRVDHILATRPLADRAKRCDIDLTPRQAEKPSDHTFVWAEFDVS